MTQADKLRERAEALIKRAAELDAILQDAPSMLRPVAAFGDEQKIALFNDWHRRCREYAAHLLEKGYEPKDWDHYMAEEVLGKMLGNGIWELARLSLKGD